ncbi:hypothetical protein SNE40_023171 [Patella caerulea]|uniref:Glycosyltransferase family 92 protein n=1 Tax=Patella caerulea TaxID=87958 RepID=A0AAN8IWP9_PATCE
MKIKLKLMLIAFTFTVLLVGFRKFEEEFGSIIYKSLVILDNLNSRFQIRFDEIQDYLPLFVIIPGVNLFVYSAVVDIPASDDQILDVRIAVWDASDVTDFACCFTSSGSAKVFSTRSQMKSYYRLPMWNYYARQYSCLVSKSIDPVEVFFSATSCDILPSKKVPVIIPEISRGDTAFCIKVAFGFVEPEHIVEFFEIHRILGVKKFLIHNLNFDKESLKVLKHYEQAGFLEIVPIDFPGSTSERQKKIRYKLPLLADAQVAVYDCIERLSGYQFVGIIDFDEILLPSNKYRNIPHLLKYWSKLYSNAASFTFGVENFMSNWNETNVNSSLHFMRYIYRDVALYDRPKCVHIPGRVSFVWTHDALPLPTYKKYRIPFNAGIIHHYRKCRRHISEDKCLHRIIRYKDKDLLPMEHQLSTAVKTVLRDLDIAESV